MSQVALPSEPRCFLSSVPPLIVKSTVEYLPHIETIQIVPESELRIAADRAARRSRLNLSQLVREGLREYLLRLETKAREELDRAGYRKNPSVLEEAQDWESEAAWPDQPASLRG